MRGKVLGRAIAVAAVVVGAVAVSSPAASADGRGADGVFCGPTCMALTVDGTTYGTNNRADLSLRPGTYWLTMTDTAAFHNFSLRSCALAGAPCSSGAAVDLTTVPGMPGTVTEKLKVNGGAYRLFCKVGSHEAQGMYVDFKVGGKGQVD
jgi:hypothetical protein